MENIEIIRNEVTKLLDKDNSGHGMEHINRIALSIAENANKELIEAVALLMMQVIINCLKKNLQKI